MVRRPCARGQCSLLRELLLIIDYQKRLRGPAVVNDRDNLLVYFVVDGDTGAADPAAPYCTPIECGVDWAEGRPIHASQIPKVSMLSSYVDPYPPISPLTFRFFEDAPDQVAGTRGVRVPMTAPQEPQFAPHAQQLEPLAFKWSSYVPTTSSQVPLRTQEAAWDERIPRVPPAKRELETRPIAVEATHVEGKHERVPQKTKGEETYSSVDGSDEEDSDVCAAFACGAPPGWRALKAWFA